MTRCSALGLMGLESRCWLAAFSPGDSGAGGNQLPCSFGFLAELIFFFEVIELKSTFPFWLSVPRGHLHVLLHFQSQ